MARRSAPQWSHSVREAARAHGLLCHGSNGMLPFTRGRLGMHDMRTLLISMALLVAGCASRPADSPRTEVVRVPPGTTEISTLSPADKLVADAKKLGYTLVNQNGEVYYCHTVVKTGSHAQHETTCLTQQEMADLHEQTLRSLLNNETQSRPPSGR